MPKEIEGIHLSGFFPSITTSYESTGCELAYSRGFMLIDGSTFLNAQNKLKGIFDFNIFEVGQSHCLLMHKKLESCFYSNGDIEVWVLGPACFTNSQPSTHDFNIAEYLHSQLSTSRADFFKSLISLSGTYAIVWRLGSEISILNDAHGLRSIFYSKKNGHCSSHLELLNVIEGEGESEMQTHFKKSSYEYSYQFPGNLTAYNNLVFLTPNFYLSTDTIRVHRFFPNEERVYIPMHEAKRRVMEKYATVAKKYKRKYQLAMSLTGGKDSRVSLYSTLGIKDNICYFSESRDNDLTAAKAIAKKHELNWIGFDPRVIDNSINPFYLRFQKNLHSSVFPKHVTWALKSQFLVFNIFSSQNFLHIHSNGAESARGRTADYEYAFLPDEYNFEKFFQAYLKGCVAWLPASRKENQYHRMLNDQFLKSYLQKYFDELNHNSFAHLGFNPWDFMYIEHRTACFLSQIHVLNQVTFESISLSNSRDILLDMWGVDDRYIIKTSILYQSILNEFDTDERERNLGPEYVINSAQTLSPESKELIFSGIYLIKDLVSKKLWSEASQLVNKIFLIDPEVRYIYEYCFAVCYENKDFDSLIKYANYLASSERLKNIVNFGWVESVCNRMRSEGHGSTVKQLAQIFCIVDPRFHWAFKQIAHVTESSSKEEALRYSSHAYMLRSEDQWNATLYLRLLRDCGKTDELLDTLRSISILPDKKKWVFEVLSKTYRDLSILGEAILWINKGLNAFPSDNELIAIQKSIQH